MNQPSKPVHKGRPQSLAAGGRPNTIGLGQRELTELLDRMESPEQPGKNPKRDFVRWPFREASVRLQVFHPGGVSSWMTVACRNLSRAGMAILHSAYAHTGTKCRVLLPHPAKGEVAVDGWITRCSHRSGVVHEIGIRFDHHLNVQEFLRANPHADWFSLERVAPEDLTGSIVYVDDSEIDRKIIRHFLRTTKLNLAMASSGAEALTCIDESVDLVLVDFHLGDMNGADLSLKLRNAGLQMPIIIVSCDSQAATPEVLASFNAAAFLAKPVSQDLLLRALAEFLIVQKGPTAAQVKATGDFPNPALTEGLLSALDQYARRLEDCIERQDAAGARTLCLQIAGTAGNIGPKFKDVNQLATKAAEAVTRNKSTSESISPLRALIAVCRRSVSAKTPAAAEPAA